MWHLKAIQCQRYGGEIHSSRDSPISLHLVQFWKPVLFLSYAEISFPPSDQSDIVLSRIYIRVNFDSNPIRFYSDKPTKTVCGLLFSLGATTNLQTVLKGF